MTYANGAYNCTFNASAMKSGAYAVIMNTSMPFYNPDNVSVGYQSGVSSFFIKTTPVIEYYNVTPNEDLPSSSPASLKAALDFS